MFDLTSEILQTIRNNKLRTSLTGLSVAWGIFMLITLVAIANGVVKDFSDDMMTPENQKMNIYSGVTTKPYKGYRDGRTVNLKIRIWRPSDRVSHQRLPMSLLK